MICYVLMFEGRIVFCMIKMVRERYRDKGRGFESLSLDVGICCD